MSATSSKQSKEIRLFTHSPFLFNLRILSLLLAIAISLLCWIAFISFNLFFIFSQNIYFCYKSQFTFNRCNGFFAQFFPISLWTKYFKAIFFECSLLPHSFFSLVRCSIARITRIEFQVSQKQKRTIWYGTGRHSRYPFAAKCVHRLNANVFHRYPLCGCKNIWFYRKTAYRVKCTTALFSPVIHSQLTHNARMRGNALRISNAVPSVSRTTDVDGGTRTSCLLLLNVLMDESMAISNVCTMAGKFKCQKSFSVTLNNMENP